MRICALIVILSFATLMTANDALAQREYYPRDYRDHDRYTQLPATRTRIPGDRQVGYRLAAKPNDIAPRSVMNQEYYPDQSTRIPSSNQHLEMHPRSYPHNDWNDSTTNRWHPSNCASCGSYSGHIPFVTGNIFGVAIEECCNEWEGHCECLELTSSRSNCECSNPRRGHWGCGASCSSGSCGSCSVVDANGHGFARSATQTSVSDYFHPRRR